MSAQITETQNKTAFREYKYKDLSNTWHIVLYNIKDFFFWWYIQMPFYYFSVLKRLVTVIDDRFSITLLIKTFFVPWHRDNQIVGYFIGIIVRLIYLPIAILIFTTLLLIYLAFILLWLLLPFTTMLFIIITPFINY